MNRHCIQCKYFVQHYFINESLNLSSIYKVGHCKMRMLKDGKLKLCKEWELSDNIFKRQKEKVKLESAIKKIHKELEEILIIYTHLTSKTDC